MRVTAGPGVLVGVCLASSIAFAVRTPAYLAGEAELVAADGRVLRSHRPLRWNQAPARAAAAWRDFTARNPGGWHASWDLHTGVPHRLFGTGIAAPGAVGSPLHAERAAGALLVQHVALLAPGAAASDFALVANHAGYGLRSVGYQQFHHGMPVLGGQVSFRFKNDRAFVLASTAWPDVDAPVVASPIAGDAAAAAASAWIAAEYGGAPVAGAASGPAVLPLAAATGAIEYRTVVHVQVDLARPAGRWDIYLDAATGAPVARRQRLMFASATMRYNAPERWWGATRQDYPAFGASLLVGGSAAVADDAGLFSWSGTGGVAVTARAQGPLVRVYNQAGSDATWSGNATGGGSLVWDVGDDEYADAQVTAYIHGQLVKRWASTVSDISFLDQQLETNVNIADTCNAFSDGSSINFYRSGDGCGNTARIADIVYHEFGHSLHNHAIIQGVGDFDGALSEGLGDFVAASITGDPAMGPGFFGTDESLRHCDPPGRENIWPDDMGEIHTTGMIYCGAMFDLRKNLIALLGAGDGAALTDELFYESFRRADDIPSTYVELLAWDDDDGNLDNGTPHKCEIDDAYARHGMAEEGVDAGPRATPPTLDVLTVTLPVFNSQVCTNGNIGGATLQWRLRHDPEVGGELPMDSIAEGFQAAIPPPPWGSVVQYRVTATPDGGGAPLVFPNNPADPWYELFVGEVTVLYCTDFETDPAEGGWTHELVSGTAGEGADDWQWGESFGQSGDPRSAYSGVSVYGNDLGPEGWNGQYQNGKLNRATMPAVDTQGFEVVRLQYRRWLNVEDGAGDHARITAGGAEVWSNLADAGQTHHLDAEWRFHDVDLSASVAGGMVQLAFEIESDDAGAYGGWTLDDVCIVGYNLPVCGDGVVGGDEQCDDANTDEADGCTSACTTGAPPSCGDGVVDVGEECDDGNSADGDGCSTACLIDEGDGDASGGCCRSSTGSGGWLLIALVLAALRPSPWSRRRAARGQRRQ